MNNFTPQSRTLLSASMSNMAKAKTTTHFKIAERFNSQSTESEVYAYLINLSHTNRAKFIIDCSTKSSNGSMSSEVFQTIMSQNFSITTHFQMNPKSYCGEPYKKIKNIGKLTWDDISSLYLRLTDLEKPQFLDMCYAELLDGNIDQVIFQSLLREVWTGNHSLLNHLNREQQLAMFNDAKFEPPKVDVGFKIYRGFSLPKKYGEVEALEIGQRLSWTTNKSIAMGFVRDRVTIFGSSRVPVDKNKYNCWLSSIEVVNNEFIQDQFIAKFDDREEDEIIFYDDGMNEGLYQEIELLV